MIWSVNFLLLLKIISTISKQTKIITKEKLIYLLKVRPTFMTCFHAATSISIKNNSFRTPPQFKFKQRSLLMKVLWIATNLCRFIPRENSEVQSKSSQTSKIYLFAKIAAFSGSSEELWTWTFIHTSWGLKCVSERILFSRLLQDLICGPCI